MNDTTVSFTKLVNDILIYYENLGLAICKPCQVAFLLDPEVHLFKHHKMISAPERRVLKQHIQSLPGRRSLEEINSDLCTGVECEAIKGLNITDGWKCDYCNVFGAEATIIRHCRNHGWITGQRNTYYISD